jgi:Flp pilus assembly protein TadD
MPVMVCALALAGGAARPQGGAPQPARAAIERAYAANNVGVAWLEQFNFQKGADAFREALRIAPSLALARFNLALALLYANDGTAAAREAREAAALMPSYAGPSYVLGLIAKGAGRASDAAAAFERVVQMDPEDPAANVQLGQVKLQLGDTAGAIARFETALKFEPFNATAAYNLSVALGRAGRADDARRMLERFQSLRESGSAVTFGNNYLEQGRYAEAVVSTGAERELVDRRTPPVRFVAQPPIAAAAAATPSTPVGRSFQPRELDAAGRRAVAAAVAGGIALLDFDADGDPDLVDVGATGDRLWRNDRGRFVELPARLPRPRDGAAGLGALVGDYNNDGRADLLVLRHGSVSLVRNDGAGRFSDRTAAAGIRIGPAELPVSAAFVDYDHDGDLDLLLCGYLDLTATRAPARFPDDFPSAAARLWRNNGTGTFTDLTRESKIAIARAPAVVASDYDERRDVDLVMASETGRLALFKNVRDGSFTDVARDVGLTATGRLTALAAADVNRDGRTDFLVGRADGPASLALSTGRDRFRTESAPAALAGIVAARFVDYDNDGLVDVLAWTARDARLLRNVGDGWVDVTTQAIGDAPGLVLPAFAPGRAAAVADLDGDGDADIVLRGSRGLQVFRNEGGDRGGALRVRLAAQVSNRSAAGSNVELRAGSLKQRRETFASMPAPAADDLVFGLGGRPSVDAVRVLWPAGIVQAEIQPPLARTLTVTELNRKPSSCPYLYTWDGSRFQFITDFLGGGELGHWEAPGVRNTPDPDEYVRIAADMLRARDGRYELHVTNELEEVLYLDHLRLDVLTHPKGVELYPNEGLMSSPPAPTVYAVRGRRAPVSVRDEHGHDVAAAVAEIDRRAPDDFQLESIRGYAARHALDIVVDDRGGPADVLLLTGWTDYAFSRDNVAAFQQGRRLSPPALQVRDGNGGWRTAVGDIGVPAGRPQTVVVDLRAPKLRGVREFRIATDMRIYWDRIAVATVDAAASVRRERLDVSAARLAWRGFSEEATAAEPFTYDFARVSAISPWKTPVGGYTIEGDVRPLLAKSDDRFVIARPGDDIHVMFGADVLPTPRPGWIRTFLLYADGFSKEMDLQSASPDAVGPLPFHGMRAYPPAGGRAAGVAPTGLDDAPRRFVPSHLLSIDAFLLLVRSKE